ncbi:MAG: dihydroorotate dehydrogenase electron transfer subunit [Chromatiaceae bacterium]
MSRESQRGTLFVEDAEVLTQEAHPGNQYLMRLGSPECAQHAKPGQFVHLTCDPALLLRRPISLMRVNARSGWIEILYKVVGEGTRLLAQRRPGDIVSSIGPIGKPFQVHPERPRPLLVGGGVGMPPMVFLADALRREPAYKPLVIFGSEVPFPFQARPSQILVPGLPPPVIAAMPLLDDWGLPSRLASLQGYAGCFQGYVTDLARSWLQGLDASALAEVEVFACGPHPMLKAVAALAVEFSLPCQVSLEEFMACGVGGCAGCVVEVKTPEGPAMKRVCVDGPVFDAQHVF